MATYEVPLCHCCDKNTAVWPCPSCKKKTCHDCYTPLCPTSTETVTNCVNCEQISQLKHIEEWLADPIPVDLRELSLCITRNARFLNFEPLEKNCCRIVSWISTTASSRTKPFPLKVTIALNFMGEPYFKIRLTNHPDLDPWN